MAREIAVNIKNIRTANIKLDYNSTDFTYNYNKIASLKENDKFSFQNHNYVDIISGYFFSC